MMKDMSRKLSRKLTEKMTVVKSTVGQKESARLLNIFKRVKVVQLAAIQSLMYLTYTLEFDR